MTRGKYIFNQLYDKPPDDRLSLINSKLDMYSIGLVILKITIYKYRGLSDSEMKNLPTIQFIRDNKLLDPYPDEDFPIDKIITNYEQFFELK